MYEREKDGRWEVAITDIEALVPESHLVRKIEKVDYSQESRHKKVKTLRKKGLHLWWN